MAHVAQFLQSVGASPKMSVAIELGNHLYSTWRLMCVDRVDARRSATTEHRCRRILQQQAAIRKGPKSPSFETLGPYMQHAADSNGAVRAPRFTKHVTERNRGKSNVLRQQRLAKEEVEARAEARAGGKK